MIEKSKKQDTINRGLHGAHQGHDAKTLSPIEELKCDVSYRLCKLLINVDNDTAPCYNRILPNISSLVARKKRMHKNVTFVHATTLEKAKYRLKTALGVSEGYYSHCKTFSAQQYVTFLKNQHMGQSLLAPTKMLAYFLPF